MSEAEKQQIRNDLAEQAARDASRPHSELRNLRAIVASGDRITPISRKTGTIMLGADAFSRAEDIEIGLYYELPCLFEQYEDAKRKHAADVDYFRGTAEEWKHTAQRLEEQLEAVLTDLAEGWTIIWLEDAPYVGGGDRKLDAWAERMQAKYGFDDDSFPGSRAGTSSAEGTNEANAAGPGVSSPAGDPGD